MKFVFAILVQLVLFTEGNESRDVRHTNHKNHKLNTKRLLKTAVLLKDQPAPSLKPPVSFKFPVEVDLTELESMLEKRFAVIDMIQNQLAVVEANVSTNGDRISANDDRISSVESKATTNENKIGSLTSSGMSFCQTGVAGCSSCPGKDTDGQTEDVDPFEVEVTFPKKFPGTPNVTTALNEIYMSAPGDEDTYGWRVNANSITSSGFTLLIELIDRKITKFYANWIACYTL